MATSYIVVACVSDKRWFDLDAERDVSQRTIHADGATPKQIAGATNAHHNYDHHARGGAPPLDCWIDGDPWTQTPPPEADAVSRCVMHIGDAFTHMAAIPDHSVDLIVTSPPFLALRSYLPADHPDKAKEIGSEATPAAFLSTLLALTREWRRILAPHGSIAVELGDTYSGSGAGGGDLIDGSGLYGNPARLNKPANAPGRSGRGWPLPKSLCLIPSLYAGSLAYGHNLLNPDDRIEPWRIRNLIVWHRPNPPVGALGDKVRPATSYITTACVSDKRWFDLDAERTPIKDSTLRQYKNGPTKPGPKANPATKGLRNGGDFTNPFTEAGAPPLDCWIDSADEDVWTIPTAPYKGAHYATYPIALPRRLINLMCPREVCVVCGEPRRRIVDTTNLIDGRPAEEFTNTPQKRAGWDEFTDYPHTKGRGTQTALHINNNRLTQQRDTLGWTDCHHNNYRRGIVLDPFAGSGTTLAAAAETGRDAIGIDLDPRNLWLVRERVGLFLEEVS